MRNNLIVGAGAVGTVVACYLSKAHQPIRIAIREADVDAISRAPQLCVDRVTGRPPLLQPKPPLTTAALPHAGENLFICVKHRDLPALLDSLPPTLPDGVRLIPCLNGVGVARALRERFEQTEVAAMSIMFNAQLLEPLHARITTRPQVLIDSADKELLRIFGRSGMTVRRAQGESAAWGKLLINLANAICALTHTSYQDLLINPEMGAIYIAMLDEATAVLDAAQVEYKLPAPLPYATLRSMLLRGGRIPRWIARYGAGLTHGSYPSMLADVERGKATEVDQLNGEIVRMGQSVGVPTPLNSRLVEMIHALEGQPQEYFLSPHALRARLLNAV